MPVRSAYGFPPVKIRGKKRFRQRQQEIRCLVKIFYLLQPIAVQCEGLAWQKKGSPDFDQGVDQNAFRVRFKKYKYRLKAILEGIASRKQELEGQAMFSKGLDEITKPLLSLTTYLGKKPTGVGKKEISLDVRITLLKEYKKEFSLLKKIRRHEKTAAQSQRQRQLYLAIRYHTSRL